VTAYAAPVPSLAVDAVAACSDGADVRPALFPTFMAQLAIKHILELAGRVRIGLRQPGHGGSRSMVVNTSGKDLEFLRASPKPVDTTVILFLTHDTPRRPERQTRTVGSRKGVSREVWQYRIVRCPDRSDREATVTSAAT